MTDLSIEPTVAWHHLQGALTQALEHGQRVPCRVYPEPFVSELPAERQDAAAWCASCPVRQPCLTYATSAAEPFHVWGGIDRAPRSRPSTNILDRPAPNRSTTA